MKKYQKKPVVIEALQFTGFNPKEVQEFVGDNCEIFYFNKTDRENGAKLPLIADITIHTLEGDMKVSVDDYIIKGVHGEFYPCKPDIFMKTYEEFKEK